MNKREAKEAIEIKNEDSQKSDIWNIRSILSNIFKYVDHKDMLEFSTVCKKWNSVINPIIYNTIKLNCKSSGLFGFGNISDDSDKFDAEVVECILNNSKYAQFVKEFMYRYELKPQRAIKFFQTFRFISNLTIGICNMSQCQFLGMITPLTQLQELTLSSLTIKNSFSERSYKEAVQLPSSLRKLSLGVSLIDSPKLFVQTINSHSNLIMFSYSSSTNEFLEPFYKPYPSLTNFEYTNHQPQSPQLLTKFFEYNPHIATFKLSMKYWNSEHVNYINSYLPNLEELILTNFFILNADYQDINLKFPRPTKIKKLVIQEFKLSDSSLSSILLNCPHLEELNLMPCVSYNQYKSISFINHHIFTKIKILTINCDYLSKGDFKSLLLNSPQINVLNITLFHEWKEAIISICENCANLRRLSVFLSIQMREQVRRLFHQEFYKTEFFTSKAKCNSTLTHLTLNNFNALNSKSEHFKYFKSLKSILYPPQIFFGVASDYQDTKIDMSLWPGYRFINIKYFDGYGAEFKRL
jgi:hypothetical protein